MLSSVDLERLIAVKKRDIQKEKITLGLSEPPKPSTDKENEQVPGDQNRRRVAFSSHEEKAAKSACYDNALCERNDRKPDEENKVEPIAPQLERYIRRYLGLPVMLKTGEYSPNNPLFRESMRVGAEGDALLALGQYERGRRAARQRAQREHREYLELQAKQKQEQKEKEKREREERDRRDAERERLLQERDRAIQLERERRTTVERDGEAERRALERDREVEKRASERDREVERRASERDRDMLRRGVERDRVTTVDTGVQVGASEPSFSVGVQTDESELMDSSRCRVTRAERELSPRRARDREGRCGASDDRPNEASPSFASCRSRLLSDLRHTGLPAAGGDARETNRRAEQEAAEKKLSYQQELKNQILEQQRIREERKQREQLLEQAEMRRLSRQLSSLRAARGAEERRHEIINTHFKANATDFEKKRTALQKEIKTDSDLLRSKSQPTHLTSHFDSKPVRSATFTHSLLPDYDVDQYLRKNLNPSQESLSNGLDTLIEKSDERRLSFAPDRTIVVEKALVHEPPKEVVSKRLPVPAARSFNKDVDTLPIPVLRHSPRPVVEENSSNLSDSMKKVDGKWQVPVVQKNIVKLASGDGKGVSILTQLGSIRRQLQMEQMRLDKMIAKE